MTDRSIFIHPLAIASVCDQFTKVSSGGTKLSAESPTLGLLFGTNQANKLSIFDAEDVFYSIITENGNIEGIFIDNEIENKINLITAVYPSYRLLGWYTAGNEISSYHIKTNKSFIKYCDNPILLLLNPFQSNDIDTLPLSVYEMTSNQSALVECTFTLDSDISERIAIDAITKYVSQSNNNNSYLDSYVTSIHILEDNIDVIVTELEKYLTISQESEQVDHSLLRSVNKVANLLPSLNDYSRADFQYEASFKETSSRIAANKFVAVSTKAMFELSQLIDVTSLVCNENRYK